MASDKDLQDLIKDCSGNEDYFSINYFCLRKNTLLVGGNVYGVVTANKECLTFYFLKPSSFKIKKENVFDTFTLPVNTITKLKVGKFIIWNSIKIKCNLDDKVVDLKLMIADKAIGIKGQKENASRLAFFLKHYKLENKLR